jgi:cell division protein FtsI/penicillin-binding protein 2
MSGRAAAAVSAMSRTAMMESRPSDAAASKVRAAITTLRVFVQSERRPESFRLGKEVPRENANIPIASKTGTAEHGPDPKNTQPYGWYGAFAPANNTQIVVAVMVTSGNLDLPTVGPRVASGSSMINASLGG